MSLEGKLTKAQKAAAVLVAMGKPSAGRLLRFFKHEELKALIEAARQLRTIPQSELENIVAEFEEEFTEGAGLLDSADQMDTIINESLSAEEISALMGWGKPSLMSQEALPIWPELAELSAERLHALIKEEHPQTIAMVFANLDSEPAANALLIFDKRERAEILKRMLAMTTVQPAAKQLVENQLRIRLTADGRSKDASTGQAKVASLLNELDKSVLDEIVSDLEATGIEGVDEVKARLFTFDDIVLLDIKSRITLFDGISAEAVTLALRDAPAELVEAVLSSLGARARRMIEAELSVPSDAATPAEVAAARKRISGMAISLAANGVIDLPAMQNAA
ncbi:FliG C-terminal domain-containing protein [Aquamicrobium zhengzhouense]|uniref:Flagellar motor switch protein FliG n=1 Tax=Aquamicrobium zhengzhouense TaxID=2781738 RepID=A0ABS0S8Y5_9HYPH|nr:FliG C-terminal domain-containing protein [Aquamicrobium zhengzhouense]MBI1619758.1 flagellar motor switch protein FliG [Aquamicrobium zhengzhouense]